MDAAGSGTLFDVGRATLADMRAGTGFDCGATELDAESSIDAAGAPPALTLHVVRGSNACGAGNGFGIDSLGSPRAGCR